MNNDFYIYHNKFQDYSDKAVDFYLKSGSWKYESDEWKICRLRQNIYNKEAMRCLRKAVKVLNG